MRRRSRRYQTNFDINNLVEKELVDKFSLWILRILFKLNTINDFIDKDGEIREENLALFLGLENYIDNDEISKDYVVDLLKTKLRILEKRKRFSNLKTFKTNLKNISNIAELDDYEISILEFAILLNQYDILDDCTGFLGRNLNSGQTKRVLSIILDIPQKVINRIFSQKSRLGKSSLLTLDTKYSGSLNDNFNFITDSFAQNMLICNEEMETILKEVIYNCDKTELCIKDFEYIKSELNILIPYLKNAIKLASKGVNVLLYGIPGTGKTELAKVISDEIKSPLYEISYCDENDEPVEGNNRLRAFKFAQSLLSNKNAILMFDEVEDIFNSDDFLDRRQKNKAWINRTLENNEVPTIWITNNVNSIDNAIIRRFDLTIEVPIPIKSKRKDIINKYSQNQIGENTISSLSKNEKIAPALVSRAAKIVSNINVKDKDKAFEMIIQNTLKAQGHDLKEEDSLFKLPKIYQPSYINSDIDLEVLVDGIKQTQNARLCIYGPAGTGKSAYGKYIAQVLDKPLILKKGSDLISMWVGGTEKNIANAFKEAKEEDGVLVFDEVDSFLQDRENATKSWEVTQVNEMLVQMENYNGIFIATTNLMDNLDRASLRRFDLKMKFGFLKASQIEDFFKAECKNLNITVENKFINKTKLLSALTPGDFAAVSRQNRFMPIKDSNDFYNRLKEEVEIKNLALSKNMGFIR